ncbi:MAG: 50S ribosomal protein L3 [Candidatus Bathyarchaeia archaeon]
MGRRRINAPRRGSLAYLPRGRAASWVARIRNWPETSLDKPSLLGFPGYKVGMSYMYLLGSTRGNPTFGQEIHNPITVVETPPIIVIGYRGYAQTYSGLQPSIEVWSKKLPKELERTITIPKKEAESSPYPSTLKEVRVIVATQPSKTGTGRKKPEILEVKVDGGTVKDRLEYAKSLLGREIDVTQVFTEGQYVDVAGITKGKGIQGPVKRFGVKTKQHKSRKTVRGVGTLGPWTPHYVMYTVPRAGQTGFHQRTEYNKLILKIGTDSKVINPKGGFQHYGIVRTQYVAVKGSLPGPSKRTVMLRYAMRPPVHKQATLQITFSGLGNTMAA